MAPDGQDFDTTTTQAEAGPTMTTTTPSQMNSESLHDRAKPQTQSPPQRQVESKEPIDETKPKPNPKPRRQPVFHPPLWLARRTACIQALKKEGIKSVVDLGCGEGAVLQLLTQPAYHLDTFPDIYAADPVQHSFSSSTQRPHREMKLGQLRRVTPLKPQEEELHLRRLIAVDIDRSALQRASQASAPPEPNASTQENRWEELRVEIYEGGLESYNQAFEGIEAMIATEVIEHLPERLVDKFASTILGLYQPRLVIVTTPNHEFNPYFVATSEDDESSNRFPDPTGRTKRIFRNDDHQLEWSRDEFENWANRVAEEHDYHVSFSGVGSLSNYYADFRPPFSTIPFPPPSIEAHPECVEMPGCKELPADPRSFFATQIAIFKRIYTNEVERSPRSGRPQPLPFYSSPTIEQVASSCSTQAHESVALNTSPSSTSAIPSSTRTPTASMPAPATASFPSRPRLITRKTTSPIPHSLVQTHTHPVDSSVANPCTPQQILDSLRRIFRDTNPPPTSMTTTMAATSPSSEERASRRGPGPSLSLARIWSDQQMRLDCGGRVGHLIEALLEEDLYVVEQGRGEDHDDPGEEKEPENEWDFKAVLAGDGQEEKRGMEGLMIEWKRQPLVESGSSLAVDRTNGDEGEGRIVSAWDEEQDQEGWGEEENQMSDFDDDDDDDVGGDWD